ncbi:hypothetical protein ACFYSC_22185 [Streptosporangium sp. NPDC004379]|uniref:hypothetical protein n=1 Tax=Streptosporangium sp. NPDC004379 TaxID=3366189 RepID=UPI0036841B74
MNAALDDLRDRVARAGGEVDHEALLARLRELQSDSVRQMESFAQSIGEIVGRIESRTER